MRATAQVLLSFATLAAVVRADCCNAVLNCRTNFLGITTCYQCGDGSIPTPYCGNGQCNAFGCNCDGGCRGGAPGLQRTAQYPLRAKDSACSYDSTFEAVAADPSRGVSLAEYLVWATTQQPAAANNATALQVWEDTFKLFDANGDGVVDFAEMHKPLSSDYRAGL